MLPRGRPESRLMLPPEPPQPVLLLTSSSPHLIQRPHPAVRPPPAVLCAALGSPWTPAELLVLIRDHRPASPGSVVLKVMWMSPLTSAFRRRIACYHGTKPA